MAYPVFSRNRIRFLGNTNRMEVHDRNNEKTQCQIDEILAADHAVGFVPDTLEQAHSEGYDNGYYCIGGATR